MSEWGTADAALFQILCDEGELDLFEVHTSTKLAPANLYFAASRLVDLGFAEMDELIVKRGALFELQAVKLRWLIANRPKYWMEWKLDAKHGVE